MNVRAGMYVRAGVYDRAHVRACRSIARAISFPKPTYLLVSTKTRVLVLTKRHVGSGNEIVARKDGNRPFIARLKKYLIYFRYCQHA